MGKKQWEKCIDSKTNPMFNEFYTTYEQAEAVLRPMLKHFDGKRVCCPCDGAESNIVKWLLENTNCDVTFFDYLDFNSEEARSIMNRCDVIITNPPFSMKHFKPFAHWLIDNKKDCLIWGPFTSETKILNNLYTYTPRKCNIWKYAKPSGEFKVARTAFYTTFKPEWRPNTCKVYAEDKLYRWIAETGITNYDKDEYEFLGKDDEFCKKHNSYVRIKIRSRRAI